MTQLDDNPWRKVMQRLWTEIIFFLRWIVWVPIGTAVVTYLTGGGWIAIAIASTVVTVTGLLILAIYSFATLRPLAKWRDLTNITDLTGFEEINIKSVCMPNKILERQNINFLQVMGNGCSKWTMSVGTVAAIDSFKQIRNGGGTVHFLASCPIYLNELNEESKVKKAKKNASSLIKLREFAEKSKSAGGTFVIKTYKHVATLRLIILNETECIVGHYQEDGDGDSFDTPLLIFHYNHENKWGFAGAFKRMFVSEWHRAKEPTAEEWKKMEELAHG